jgi:hypothetical protein
VPSGLVVVSKSILGGGSSTSLSSTNFFYKYLSKRVSNFYLFGDKILFLLAPSFYLVGLYEPFLFAT